MSNRRAFLLGAASLLAAPAIVRAESLMPIYVPKPQVINPYAEIEKAVALALRQFIFERDKLAVQMADDELLFGCSVIVLDETSVIGVRRVPPHEWVDPALVANHALLCPREWA